MGLEARHVRSIYVSVVERPEDAKLLQQIAKALESGNVATADTVRRMLGMLTERVGSGDASRTFSCCPNGAGESWGKHWCVRFLHIPSWPTSQGGRCERPMPTVWTSGSASRARGPTTGPWNCNGNLGTRSATRRERRVKAAGSCPAPPIPVESGTPVPPCR